MSVAYHLAKAGLRDVLLLEKGELTSGSTCHAAGLVTQFNPSPTMMRFRRYSVELYRELGVFDRVGSLRIASSRESLAELERGASRASGIGLDVEVLSPEEVVRLLPAATRESLYGAVWIEGDGSVDPHIATHTLANAARGLGARIETGRRVTGIRLGPSREVTAVETDAGPVETELVVNACGIWAPQVAAMVGAFTPSVPVDHQHIALAAVDGHELPREMPCFRDLDNLVYGKSEAGGILFGGYEPNPVARWIDGVPWEHAGAPVPPDHDRFEQLMDGAVRRFPFLHDAGVVALICHPDAMTPDGNPLLGPMPGVPGFWTAAGLSLNGFGGAGGLGKTVAEWITRGRPSSTSPATARGASARHTAIRSSRRRRPGRSTATTTASAIRSTWTNGAGLSGSRPCTDGFRISARSSARRTGGSARTSSSRGGRAGRAGADQRAYGFDRAALVRAAPGGARGLSRAGRDHRHDLVREDRGLRPRRAAACSSGSRTT